MSQWLHERYISREEHQQSIEYYTKLVAQLYRQICELRSAQVVPVAVHAIIEEDCAKGGREMPRQMGDRRSGRYGNVISVDFRGQH